MNILLDSHILLWIGFSDSYKLSTNTKKLLENPNNNLYFSLVNIWELTIKSSLNRLDFPVDVEKLRFGLLQNGLTELTINAQQIFEVKRLGSIHQDPFDRLLLAQAITENFYFLTVDEKILQYPYEFIIDASK